MIRRIRILAASATVTGALLALPSGAGAAESCVFQGVTATAANQQQMESSLLCLTNLHRVRNGLQPVLRDSRLATAARAHSADMVARGFFEHVSPEGHDPSFRAMAAGYPGGAGENIGTDTRGTPLDLFEGFRASPGHNANMLNPPYVAGGFGIVDRAAFGGSGGRPGITATENFGFAPANSTYTGFDLYASSDKCAKAKATVFAKQDALAKAKRKAAKRRLRADARLLRRTIAKICKPPV